MDCVLEELEPETIDAVDGLENFDVVYFIHAVGTNRIKIGYTSNPVKRFAQLCTASPFPLHLLAIHPGG